MRYTYKREYFFGDWKTNRTIAAGAVVLLLSVLLASQAVYVALMMGVIGVLVLLVGIGSAAKRHKKALAHRQEMMEKGYLSKGEIVDAGGKLSVETEYTYRRDENNRQITHKHLKGDWWIEVQYYDEKEGIYKRFRALSMKKNGKLHGMIGKQVEVYKYDDFVYINVP